MIATLVREFPDASFTGPPFSTQIGDEQVFCFMSRPRGGGPMCVINVVAGDGRDFIPPVDMRDFLYADCFGAVPFVSRFTGTLKLGVNVKLGPANDRALVMVDTGRVVV